MNTLYVYRTLDNTLVARITGQSNAACEAAASDNNYDADDFGWTYSPAFGTAGGITPGDNVRDIDANLRAVIEANK